MSEEKNNVTARPAAKKAVQAAAVPKEAEFPRKL